MRYNGKNVARTKPADINAAVIPRAMSDFSNLYIVASSPLQLSCIYYTLKIFQKFYKTFI